MPSADTLWSDFATAPLALAPSLSGSKQVSIDSLTVAAAVIFSLSRAAEDDRVLQLGDTVFDAAAGGFALLCCVFWPGKEGVSPDTEEEEQVEALLTLAEDEGFVGDLVGWNESFDLFGDIKEELEEGLFEEPLVDLDE